MKKILLSLTIVAALTASPAMANDRHNWIIPFIGGFIIADMMDKHSHREPPKTVVYVERPKHRHYDRHDYRRHDHRHDHFRHERRWDRR